ncbi:MAG: glucuronate isomerase, partial [Methylobacteriaceae bacterium]|nr:glucuronate isomerase [Methylobacteriaceae bacterium]
MVGFFDRDFLLNSKTARRLYYDFAADQPIIDYHSHLPQGDILGRKKFRNMAAIWLGEGGYGDHYKWRLMRAAGIDESLITGDAPEREKFNAFCRILPLAAGNPIYHFSHLELRRIFGIEDVAISEKTADKIWEEGNARLQELDTWALLKQARVEIACTTDDPADDLAQ